MRFTLKTVCSIALCLALGNALPVLAASKDAAMPHYSHIFVIMEENKDYGQIIGSPDAPAINRLANTYGLATNFYAETHPSEPNYVAFVGGYTYGIQDDDAYYCKPGDKRPDCPDSSKPGYPNHTIDAPSLATQIEQAGLTWKNYNESLPAPGSMAVTASDAHAKNAPADLEVYASKHSGFINFASVQRDPQRSKKIVGFGQLHKDLADGHVPNFSFVIPNLCDEMHGAGTSDTPDDCNYRRIHSLIWRGDSEVNTLVKEIMASPVWREKGNAAIVVTFDEDDHYSREGCCGTNKSDPANSGGGHIATIVITNHGPRGVKDATPYSHYSLLRTIEDALGLHGHLRQAAAPGVVPMTPLFAVNGYLRR